MRCAGCPASFSQRNVKHLYCSKPCRLRARKAMDRPCGNPECVRQARAAGRYCSCCYRSKSKYGTHTRPPRQYKRVVDPGTGYVRVRISGGYDAEHRHVMSQVLGRALYPFENVHHRNGLKSDNRPENLELWATYQPSGQRVVDLVEFVARFYPDEVTLALADRQGVA